MLTAKELRQKYIDFFKSKGHTEIPSASLLPENDPSTLFTTAGMHPLVPFLLGEKHPAGRRLVNSQKCIRTVDIDQVGNKTHHTFFEMLGHWSLGDYFKEEAIKMSYEFLTDELKLAKNKLAFTVFAGDDNAPGDQEAAAAWQNSGVSAERIAYLPKKDNWWELAGPSGPCGPCTEMFYWSDNQHPAPEIFDPKDQRWVEIGNDVLMGYEKNGENSYQPAKQKNIDNGTGLERLLAVMNGLDDDYRTDLFWPLIQKIEELSGKKYNHPEPTEVGYPLLQKEGIETVRSMRIIADHLRAAVMIMADPADVEPSNVDQGYVVRKLIRRAIRHGRMIGIQDFFTAQVAQTVVEILGDTYHELKTNQNKVLNSLNAEEEKFTKTLQAGMRQFHEITENTKAQKTQKHRKHKSTTR